VAAAVTLRDLVVERQWLCQTPRLALVGCVTVILSHCKVVAWRAGAEGASEVAAEDGDEEEDRRGLR